MHLRKSKAHNTIIAGFNVSWIEILIRRQRRVELRRREPNDLIYFFVFDDHFMEGL